MEDMHKARYDWRDIELLCPFQVHHFPSASVCSPTQQLPEPCYFRFLIKDSVGLIDLIIGHWWLAQTFKGCGVELKVPTL